MIFNLERFHLEHYLETTKLLGLDLEPPYSTIALSHFLLNVLGCNRPLISGLYYSWRYHTKIKDFVLDYKDDCNKWHFWVTHNVTFLICKQTLRAVYEQAHLQTCFYSSQIIDPLQSSHFCTVYLQNFLG